MCSHKMIRQSANGEGGVAHYCDWNSVIIAITWNKGSSLIMEGGRVVKIEWIELNTLSETQDYIKCTD